MNEEKAEFLFNKGNELATNGKFIEAIPFFEQADELGSKDATACLASIYIQGHGVDVDYDKGLPYLAKSANQGHPYSINLLGTLYYDGKGLKQDYEQAFISFSIAAEMGEPYALLNLADCYESGKGTDKNIDKALDCYLQLINGQYDDDMKKEVFVRLEKYPNNSEAVYYLSRQYDGLTIKNSTPNPEKAAEIILRAAELGNTNAQYEIGKLYEVGLGVEKDIEKSKKWIGKASEQGHEGAIYTLQYITNPSFFDNGKPVINRTKYRYKGKLLFRNHLALEITKDFVVQHPESTLKSLNEIFTVQNMRGENFEFFNSYEEVIVRRKDCYNYFHEPIKLKNGEIIAVKNCSSYNIVSSFKEIAIQYGFEIEEVIDTKKKIEKFLILGHESYYLEKNYAEAFKCYEKAAELADADAQWYLGSMYYFGEGVNQDYKRAFEWCKKAALQENVDAQNLLGNMYYFGTGVNQSYVEAFKWYKKAAEQDNKSAQCNLGNMYFNGISVEKDYKKAFEWCKKAENYEIAMINLGYMYEYGIGTEQNFRKAFDMYKSAAELGNKKAVEWIEEKANQGDADAQYQLASIYNNGNGLEQNEAKANEWYLKAFDCYEKAARQGDANAQYSLGCMYSLGYGVEKNDIEAFKWYEKSATQGNANAQHELGEIYLSGYRGVTRNYEKALSWYEKAAKQGNPDFQSQLGRIYHCVVTEPDFAKAFEWYKKAAEQGDSCAQSDLGDMYYYGEYVEQNYAEAAKWYKKSYDLDAKFRLGNIYHMEQNYVKSLEWYGKTIKLGDDLGLFHSVNDNAKFMVGIMYYSGEGIEQNYEKAFRLLKDAAEQGVYDAYPIIGDMYYYGEYVEKNFEEATKWYGKAAKLGNEYAVDALKMLKKEMNGEE
ncbi:MAG: sel1 repeat family protein [Spirochaetaceae bacterium]|nr:sel1 repeat family protein [Spirochaetaceae bacterium]